MSQGTYSCASPDAANILAAYGEKFMETSFFDEEEFGIAKGFVSLYCDTEIVDSPGKQHLLLLEKGPARDLSKLIMDSNRTFYNFLCSMLELKTHMLQVLDNVGCSRELAKFSAYVTHRKKIGDSQGISSEISSEEIVQLMFWGDGQLPVTSLDTSALQLPVLSFEECSLTMAELLVWLCHPSRDITVPNQVLDAFLFINTKLVDSNSCLTSTQFALHWLYLHLSLYFRIIVVQFRVGSALDKIEKREELKYLDNSETVDRFVLLARLAAVLGFIPTPEFREYVRELDVGSYIRYNHYGMLDIVFSKISVSEYNWPIQILGVSSRQEVVDNLEAIKEVIEGVTVEELKDRLVALVKECESEEFSELKFAPSETLNLEALKITETKMEAGEETKLSFSISIPEGWDLDAIPE